MNERIGIRVLPRTGLPVEARFPFSQGSLTNGEKISRVAVRFKNFVNPPKKEKFPEEEWA